MTPHRCHQDARLSCLSTLFNTMPRETVVDGQPTSAVFGPTGVPGERHRCACAGKALGLAQG